MQYHLAGFPAQDLWFKRLLFRGQTCRKIDLQVARVFRHLSHQSVERWRFSTPPFSALMLFLNQSFGSPYRQAAAITASQAYSGSFWTEPRSVRVQAVRSPLPAPNFQHIFRQVSKAAVSSPQYGFRLLPRASGPFFSCVVPETTPSAWPITAASSIRVEVRALNVFG